MASLLWKRSLAVALGCAAVAAASWLWPRQASSDEPVVQADPARQAPPLRSPPAAPPGPERREPRRVAALRWGSGEGALGHEIPEEGAPQGPMTFAVDGASRIHALDTVNGRVVVIEGGRAARSAPLPSLTIDDLEVLDDGGYLALDRHIGKAVHVLTAAGVERGRVELEGPEIPHPGLVTALFHRADGIWVEIEHRRLVRVGDAAGLPVLERAVVAGRFDAAGQGTLAASRVPPASVRVLAITPSLQARTLAEPSFALPVAIITALEPLDGGVALGVLLHRDSMEPPYKTEEVRHLLVGLDAGGAERWRAELPADEGPEENGRPVRLGRDGALYGMVFRRDGVEFWKVTP